MRSTARQANFVIVNSHSHESGATRDVPPQFMVDFAGKCLDAGAATYIIHGPHRLRGIEIYKGRPIFYSLADLIFQYETTEPQGTDIYEDFGVFDNQSLAGELYEPEVQGRSYGPDNPVWFESVVAVPAFRGLELVELKLYPIELVAQDEADHGRRQGPARYPPPGSRGAGQGDHRSGRQALGAFRHADRVSRWDRGVAAIAGSPRWPVGATKSQRCDVSGARC